MAEEEKKPEPQAEEVKKPKKEKKSIDLSKGSLTWTIWHLVEAILLLVGGILCIVFSDNKDVQNDIYPVVGAFLILGGFLKILTNFLPVVATSSAEAELKMKAKKAMAYDMVIGGSFELALGITLCVIFARSSTDSMSTIATFLSTFIAIIFMVAGASLLLFAIGFIVAKLYRLYMPILEIIFGLALIALGVVVIIYMSKADVFNRVVLIIVGVIIALAGLGMLVDTLTTVSAKNKAKRAAKEAGAAQPAEESATVEVSIQEVDLSTEEGKNAAPEAKEEPKADEPTDDKK
jgi:hypothetical protein